MKQVIRYHGLSLAKDELSVNNGELALCGGVELHDGSLRPSFIDGTKLSDRLTDSEDNDVTLIYIHQTSSFTHLIGWCAPTARLCWYNEDGSFGGDISHEYVTVKSVSAVGNTLVVIAADGMHYILWKNTLGSYKYLGQKPPFLSISFDLSSNLSADYEVGGISAEGSASGFNGAFQQTTVSCGDAFSSVTKSTAFAKGEIQLRVKTDKQSDITENVWGLVNRTNDLIAKQGHFYANFFIRYCYRLYDGSMVMHSAPIFMPVLVPGNFLVYVVNAHMDANNVVGLDDTIKVNRVDSNGNNFAFSISKLTFMYAPRNVKLLYTWMSDNATIDPLKEWSDIVSSIDVFITPPVTRTDTSQTIKSIVLQPDNLGYRTNGVFQNVWHYNGDSSRECRSVVEFPGLSDQAYVDKITNQAAFFKVCSFKIDELYTTGQIRDLPVDESAVLNIATREQMVDDYKSHNFLMPSGAYVYNHRVNLYGLSERLFPGFTLQQLYPYYPFLNLDSANAIVVNNIVVRLNTEQGYKFVTPTNAYQRTMDVYYLYNTPFFYPDARADCAWISYTYRDSGVSCVAQFRLKSCNELNASVYMGVFSTSYPTTSAPGYTVDDIVNMPNKIYTSEVDNPYYFPVAGINTVGTGDIVGLASTTRALSQGQFGQYPLMAFCTDGIWALQVSSTGTYSSIHPISREVCINPKSIAQLDQSVVFASDRALNKVVESSVASFSDILDGPFFPISTALPNLLALFTDGGKYADNSILQLINFNVPPIECFKSGTVLYDFVNSRLLVFPAVVPKVGSNVVALVYSLRDNAWSTMMAPSMQAAINAYPYPYIQWADGSVYVLNENYNYDDSTQHAGIVVTRTLTFDAIMSAITGFDNQSTGKFQVLMIFGSDDLSTWHYVGRSSLAHADYLPGHTYRYFRLALFVRMSASEQYNQTALSVTQKYVKL